MSCDSLQERARIATRYSQLDSLAVTGHVHFQVKRVVQHLYSKQIILQVTPQISKLKQFTLIKYCPV